MFLEWGRGPPPSRLIDDEGAKRKVRSLIANIGNYATLAWARGIVGICPSPSTGFYSLETRTGPDDSAVDREAKLHNSTDSRASRVLTQISIKLALKHFPSPHSPPSIQRARFRNWHLHRGTSNCSDFRQRRRPSFVGAMVPGFFFFFFFQVNQLIHVTRY